MHLLISLRGALHLFAGLATLAAGHARDPVRLVLATDSTDDFTVGLITAGRGDGFITLMGHAAIIVTNRHTGQVELFDFGEVPRTWATVRGLLTGHLSTRITHTVGNGLVHALAAEDRQLRWQELNLRREERLDLLRRLSRYSANDVTFEFDSFRSNCTTHIRALLDSVTRGALQRAGSEPFGPTLRNLALDRLSGHRVIEWIARFAMNDAIDYPTTRWEAAALPWMLADLVGRMQAPTDAGGTVSFAVDHWASASHRSPLPTPLSEIPWTLFVLGCGIGVVALLLAPAARRGDSRAILLLSVWSATVGGLLGGLALFVLIAALFTGYTFTTHNANLWICHPLLLSAIPLGLAWVRGSAAAGAALRFLWLATAAAGGACIVLQRMQVIHQQVTVSYALAAPAIAGLALAYLIAVPAPRSVMVPAHVGTFLRSVTRS